MGRVIRSECHARARIQQTHMNLPVQMFEPKGLPITYAPFAHSIPLRDPFAQRGRLPCGARMRRLHPVVFAAVVLGATSVVLADRPTEYGSKAKIFLMVLPYIQWPSQTTWPEGPFKIAVLGDSPFGTRLDEGIRTLTVHQRPIQIRYVSKVRDAEGCQALFICSSELPRIHTILAWVAGREILTVSDDATLAKRGVMLNLLLEDGFVRLAVNPEATHRPGLVLGSRLMSLARTVSTERAIP